MSCDADRNATSSATPPSTYGALTGEQYPITPMQTARDNWYINIQPRRRPNSGGKYRSSTGAHRNFRMYGKATRLKRPMVLISRPEWVIQACSVKPVRLKGNPEAKLNRRTAAIRLSRSACRTVGLTDSVKRGNSTSNPSKNVRHDGAH